MALVDSVQSSPRSGSLPSPPDSPGGSFSSVSSSYFFSSSAPSPPHSGSGGPGSRTHSVAGHARDHTQGLIIPSLTLPAALRRPTTWGQTIGDLRLVVLGSKGSGKTSLCTLLLDDNDDVVETGGWEDLDDGRGKMVRASTDWVDPHGVESFEPAKNVEVHELPGYEHTDDAQQIIHAIMSITHQPFNTLLDILDPTRGTTRFLTNLLASPTVPLFTALIFLLPTSPSQLELTLLEALSPLIPIILLPVSHVHPHCLSHIVPAPTLPTTSAFRPRTPLALRTGLFRSPETLTAIRTEAAERFLGWREVERAVRFAHLSKVVPPTTTTEDAPDEEGAASWSKALWEVECALSQDVAVALRRQRPPSHRPLGVGCGRASLDPLHFRSLLVVSLEIFGGVGAWIVQSVGWGVVGGFVVGIAVGMVVRGESAA